MSSLETAIERVDKLKKMAESIVGTNGETAKMIEAKLKLIQNRISKLSDLRNSLKTRFQLLSSQTADIQRLVSQTQGLEQLENKIQLLQTQISGVNNLDLTDLDKTIEELEKLITSGSPDNQGGTPGTQPPSQTQSPSQSQGQRQRQTTRSVSPMRSRPSTPPGSSSLIGGYRYDSISKSRSKRRSKTRRNRRKSNSRSKTKRRSVSRSRK